MKKLKKNKNRKKDKKILNSIKKFFNNPIPLIIVLIISNLFLLIYINNSNTKNKIFVGELSTDKLSIVNIHYFTNKKMNYFYASNCAYNGKEEKIYSYEIGYYVVDNDKNYTPFLVRQSKLDKGILLKDVIADMSGWNVVERNNNQYYFTNDIINNIDNLHFVIKASTKKDSQDYDINIDEEVSITKLLK